MKIVTQKKIRGFGIVLLLTVLSVAMIQTALVNANFKPGPYSLTDIYSPVAAPYIYRNTTVDILGSYCLPSNWTQINYLSYSLDSNANSTLPNTKTTGTYSLHNRPEIFFSNYCIYSVSKPLENLANGNHTLAIYANLDNGTVWQIYGEEFTVDTAFVAPNLTIISPLNQTYSTKDVPLTYSMNSNVTWAFYNLDSYSYRDSNWINPNGNITLTNFSVGTHKIDIAVRSEADAYTGDSFSVQTVYFTVGEANSDIFNAPATQSIITATIVLAIVIVSLVIVLVVRRRQSIGSP
jgi:hypothetical protein